MGSRAQRYFGMRVCCSQISGVLLPVHCGHNGEVGTEDISLLELAMEAAQFGTKNS